MWKRDHTNCCCKIAVRLLQHGMKAVERVVKRKHHRILSVGELQFGSMPGRGTIDAVFIL